MKSLKTNLQLAKNSVFLRSVIDLIRRYPKRGCQQRVKGVSCLDRQKDSANKSTCWDCYWQYFHKFQYSCMHPATRQALQDKLELTKKQRIDVVTFLGMPVNKLLLGCDHETFKKFIEHSKETKLSPALEMLWQIENDKKQRESSKTSS